MPSKRLKTSFAGVVGFFGAVSIFITIALEILVLTGQANLLWWQVLLPVFIWLGLVVMGVAIVCTGLFIGLVIMLRRR